MEGHAGHLVVYLDVPDTLAGRAVVHAVAREVVDREEGSYEVGVVESHDAVEAEGNRDAVEVEGNHEKEDEEVHDEVEKGDPLVAHVEVNVLAHRSA